MKPTKPFLLSLAALLIIGVTLVSTKPSAHAATVNEGFPLSTALTPAMIDYFAVTDAFERPSMAGLIACSAAPACASSDTSRVRVLDATGTVLAAYDGQPTTIIEQVRQSRTTLSSDVRETRTKVRRYTKDVQGRLVMQGTDTIVKIDAGGAGREPSVVTLVHRYSDVRYLLTDPRYLWPITGLVVLEVASSNGSTSSVPTPLETHAAVSFDGTQYVQVLTSSGLMHRVDLRMKRLETAIPDR